MTWSINELARITGLTSRTLRHYDAIGLLPPASTDLSGRRHYGRPELLRLQEILLLRDLGLSLADIDTALARRGDEDRVAVLASHLEGLRRERERLGQLIATVQRTIESLQEGTEMEADQMFDGVIQNPYEAEARERWGDETVDRAHQRLRQWSAEDRELLTSGRGFEQAHQRLATLKAEGLPVDDPRVQEVIAFHHGVVSLAWTPNAEAYVGLGEMYVEDQRFRQSIGGGDDGLVRYLRDAMKVFAERSLSDGV